MGSGGKEKEPKQKKKPGRVPTSCAECRRLKLRCDRNVPCEKCVSRGCGSICPDGVLTPGKGNRLILANTEQLHERIDQISARNRELENALRKLQEVVSDQPHPLLETEKLRINMPQGSSSGPPSTSSSSKSPKSTSRISPTTHPPDPDIVEVKIEDGRNVIDAFGTLVVGRRGESNFLGKTARPEYLAQAMSKPMRPSRRSLPRLSDAILAISYPEPELCGNGGLLSEMFALLPSQSDALNLCDLYLEYGKFLYSPMPRDLLDETLSVVYRTKKYSTFEHHHSLSLLFIVFAIATLFDPNKQPHSSEAHEYYYLSRTALLISPPMHHTTPTGILTLIHMAQFLDVSDADPSGVDSDSGWAHLGQAMRLAQSIGLHMNSTRWKLPQDHAQGRHVLFWKLFVADTWASLNFGRPSSISRAHIDCPIPEKLSHLTPGSDADPSSIFHSWHLHFTILLHTVMATALGTKQPIYSTILDYDRKIRDFHVPIQWRVPSSDEALSAPSSDVAMYRWLILSAKEIALLHLHQAYFAQALQESPVDVQRHRYLPSVVSIYRSTCRLIHGLAMTWRLIPKFLARVNLAWSYGLSAAIVACLFVTRAPTSQLTSGALEELDNLASLFDSSSPSCRSAAKLLPSVQSLCQKAHAILGHSYTRYHPNGEPLSAITLPELDRLNGKTHLFSFADHSSTSYLSAASSSSSSSSSSLSSIPHEPRSPATSVTISDITDSHPPFSHNTHHTANSLHLHPTLSQDLHNFGNRNAAGSHSLPPLSLFDHPSDAAASTVERPTSLSPRPSHHAAHRTPPEPARLLLQPYQPHGADPPRPPQPPTQPMQYFNQTMQQQHDVPNFFEPRRSATAAFTSPFGGTFPSGFQSGFFPGGFSSGFCPSPIVLDSSWNSFVEQLGF